MRLMPTQLTERRAAALDPGGRSTARLRAHFEIERDLAQRLRAAPRDARGSLYGTVYDELFRQVPDHPQHTRAADAASEERLLEGQERIIRRFLPPGGSFLEVGAGDCKLSLRVCAYGGAVRAVEVSPEIAVAGTPPPNFELLLTDGTSIPVPTGSVDLAYSNQLMEHLHPDDAEEQLRGIRAALAPGGRYVCLTPHGLVGPSDISAFFCDDEPQGFHLKEYTTGELATLCKRAGFDDTRVLAVLPGRVLALPSRPFTWLERAVSALPRTARLRIKRWRGVRKLLSPGGGVVAIRRR